MSIGAMALMSLLGFAVTDYELLLPPPLRYATSAILAMLAGLGAWRWRALRQAPTSLKEAALDAEAQQNETDCVVSTAAEYASGRAPPAHAYEPELASALQTVAAQRLGTVRPADGRALRGPLSVLAAALAALVVFIVVIPGAWTALGRVSLPWLGSQYTRVEVQPRNIEVPVGRSVEVSSVFRGRPPKDPRIQWQVDGARLGQSAALTRAGQSAFVHTLTNVTVPLKYRVSGGDALSPEFLVSPYTPPEVEQLSLGLAYPDYTRLKPSTQAAPDITVLRGSTATLHVRANVNLQRARLRFSDTNLPPLELSKNTNEWWTGRLEITNDLAYRIELFDQKGRPGSDLTSHSIVPTPDLPPRVEILEPGQDLRADATNRIPIRVSVADDYGVAGIRLIYHKLNNPPQSVVCQTESAKNGEWLARAELNLAALKLTRYDVVAYHVEARDNNTLDGPGIGRSPLYFVEITDQQALPTPPAPPRPGEQVNLVVVQKQIIADTVAASPATNCSELALRQTNAVELGRLYLATMPVASTAAVTEMKSAIAAMEQAIPPLHKRDAAAAVPPEETALAHLYRVLALLPEAKLLAVTPKPPPIPKEQKPQRNVALREIQKPAPELAPADPELEKALAEARELSRNQAELNALEQQLAKSESRDENPALAQAAKPAPPQPAKGEGQGQGQGEGQGLGQGEGQGTGQGQAGQGDGNGKGEKPPEKPGAAQPQQLARNTNSVKANPPLARTLTQTNRAGSTNVAKNSAPSERQHLTADVSASTPPAADTSPLPSVPPDRPTPLTPLALGKNANGTGTKPGKGPGKGKGKANAPGQKGKGKGQGTKPGNGSGRPSTQQNGEPPEMAAGHPEPMPKTPEELAEKQEELSAEAKTLGEMLQRLAGQGTRVGHNLARSANKAAEHMEGAALALKQGNASGAGMRGTQSSAELDQLVAELERVVGKRPNLTDVASEEAPKEYEDFISEYFRRLSYEK